MIKRSTDSPELFPQDLCGVVLCGGKSRRFGSDKAQAMYSGTNLVTRAFRALQEITIEIVVASGSPERAYVPGVVHVHDRWADAGPLAGIEAAFFHSKASALLLLAADLPLVSTTDLQVLLDAFKSPLTVASDRSSGRLQPLCAIWHRSLHEPLQLYLESGGRSVMGFLDGHSIQPVAFDSRILLNVNKSGDMPE